MRYTLLALALLLSAGGVSLPDDEAGDLHLDQIELPDGFQLSVFAEHGSWNRAPKIGYRVTRVRLDSTGTATRYAPFATGWLQEDADWDRPVDVLQTPDGALLVSDDQTGTLYRITYAP